MRYAAFIAVKTLTGFTSEHAACQALGGNHARTVAGFFVILVVDGFHDRVRNIQSGQIHQFERAELEAGLIAQDAVYGGEIGDTLADDAQRFGAVAAPGMVDDEAGRVLRLHRRVAHLPGVAGQRAADGRTGSQAGNDFDHLHQRNGVEEVIARQALRMLQCRRDRRHGQR